MSTSPNHNNCLRLEEISLYVNGQLSPAEVHSIEHHLLDCELCHDAVEGYREQPFTASDIPGFETISKPSRPTIQLTRWISIAAIVLIGTTAGMIYNQMGPNAEKEQLALSDQTVSMDSVSVQEPEPEQGNADKNIRLNELIEQDKEVKELVTAPVTERNDLSAFGKKDASVWMMPQKQVEEIPGAGLTEVRANLRTTYKDTFIFDLKITSFGEYYAVQDELSPKFSSSTEARFERKDSIKTKSKEEELEKLTTEDVLVKAMENFSKNNFTSALKLFNILISYESEDVNALFYASLCYKNLNRAEDAIQYLDRVLKSSNTTFKEEAEWEKAQAYVQLKDFKKAEVLLDNICQSKGFYAERAKDLLKRVKQKNKPAADTK